MKVKQNMNMPHKTLPVQSIPLSGMNTGPLIGFNSIKTRSIMKANIPAIITCMYSQLELKER